MKRRQVLIYYFRYVHTSILELILLSVLPYVTKTFYYRFLILITTSLIQIYFILDSTMNFLNYINETFNALTKGIISNRQEAVEIIEDKEEWAFEECLFSML